MSDFTVKQYLLDNQLVDKDGEFICLNNLENPDWGIGDYYSDTTMIYLCTLVYFFEQECMLDNLSICLEKRGELTYRINIKQNDREHNSFQWDIILATIEHLLPHMAGSNVSWLAGGLFQDT